MKPVVKVNGAYYCDVLLLKQLLPDICQAAGDFCLLVHHCCDTSLRTSHKKVTRYVASQQTRPQSHRWQIIQSHSGSHISETARDVKHH